MSDTATAPTPRPARLPKMVRHLFSPMQLDVLDILLGNGGACENPSDQRHLERLAANPEWVAAGNNAHAPWMRALADRGGARYPLPTD